MNTYIIDEERASVNFLNLKELLERSDPPMTVKLTTGCPLCDKVWSSKEAYEYSMDWADRCAIVMENGKCWLYVPCRDVYYSDNVMQINYCPKCGRELVTE